MGAWYDALLDQQASSEVRDTLSTIRTRAVEESEQLLRTLRDWDRVRAPTHALDGLRDRLRSHLLRDVLLLKKRTAEVVLMAAMQAPTQALRDELVRLADDDRVSADFVRRLLDVPVVPERLPLKTDADPAEGAHNDVPHDGLISPCVRHAIESIRARGEVPTRLTLSSNALRHLRDEGFVEAATGTAFGLPVTVDFGWRGRCFAILTNECVSLAELYTAQRAGKDG